MAEKGQRVLRPKGFRLVEAVLLVILFSVVAAYFHRHEIRALAQGRRQHAVPTGSISGTVTGPDGKPASGARVMAQTSDGRSPRTARTDAKGHFRVRGLREGPYDLRARANETWSDWTRDVRVRANEDSSVKLRIASPDSATPPAKKPNDKPGPDAAP